MKRIAFHHQKRLQLKGPTFAWTARRPPSQKESIMIFPLSFPASTTFDNSRILLQKDTLGRVSLSIYVFIGTKGALRLPTTYDIHPIPFHPSIHKASFIIWTGLGLIWVDLQWPPMHYAARAASWRKNVSLLKIDSSANFHLMHDFFGRGPLISPQVGKRKNKVTTYKYHFRGCKT